MCAFREESAAAVCVSGGAHHGGCVEQRVAGLPGTVGIEQGAAPRAQSIKKELLHCGNRHE